MKEFECKRNNSILRGYIDVPNKKLITDIIILLHGFGADCGRTAGSLMADCAKDLGRAGYCSIRFDFYGCGKSDGAFKQMTLSSQLSDVVAVVQMTRSLYPMAKITLLGFSEGGLIASLAASMLKVDKLILLAPAISILAEINRGRLLGTAFDTDCLPDNLYVNRIDRIIGKAFIQECINCDIRQISKYLGPVLYCQSLHDEYVPQEVEKSYQKFYSGRMDVVRVNTSNHIFTGHERKTMLGKVIDFISRK
ncbi:alpha/beta hydrolase [Ligilactobacillus sp. LYQ139]|uniref:alpha/beta hydrolase n=1 Tax=Ligilactobacillus sp. LYQ139 TaxID=3378800 RepID=UPI003853880E